MKRLDERMVLLKKEPVHKLVTYRLESASKAVVTTASALILHWSFPSGPTVTSTARTGF